MAAAYQIANAAGSAVIRVADGVCIPNDPRNSDWRVYLDWAQTNTADPYVAPAPVYSCQLWQLQAVMTTAQWTAAQNAVAAFNNPAVSAFFTHGTNVIPSNSTTLLALGEAIGLSDDEVTTLVQQAAAVAIP